jgi:2-polyprenyl-6-methoxyphenol hydroxylase-like FAD-dependent oxidoreductase
MRTSTEVLIVGGGPVGLTLAVELQRRGIDHLIVDSRPEPDQHVKALGITPRTFEVWEQMGVLDHALRKGRFIEGIAAYVNGERTEVESVELGTMPYGFFLMAQFETEAMLRAQLARHGGHVQQGATMTHFETLADGYRAFVADGAAESTITCRYLAACDGAHSAVRKGLGIDYQGDAYAMTFMLGDVRVHWDRPHEYGRRFTNLVDGQLQNVLVCIPIPGDPLRYRLSMAAPPEYWDPQADLVTPPTLEQLKEAFASMVSKETPISDLRWSSFYRISHRIVAQYSSGAAFLVGDAAHIHPPIGGQGMNTGIQDAHNLAWKLALAVRGHASADLLDSYDLERRPVGRAVVERTTHRMDATVTEGSVRFDQWMEDSQLLISYRDTRWVADDVAPGFLPRGPRAGDRMPHVDRLRRKWIGHPVRLAELTRGTGHTLLLYFGSDARDDEFQHAARLSEALQSAYGDEIVVYGIADPHAQGNDYERFGLLTDADGDFRRAFDADRTSLWLVRPDGYIGYRADRHDLAAIENYLRRVFA